MSSDSPASFRADQSNFARDLFPDSIYKHPAAKHLRSLEDADGFTTDELIGLVESKRSNIAGSLVTVGCSFEDTINQRVANCTMQAVIFSGLLSMVPNRSELPIVTRAMTASELVVIDGEGAAYPLSAYGFPSMRYDDSPGVLDSIVDHHVTSPGSRAITLPAREGAGYETWGLEQAPGSPDIRFLKDWEEYSVSGREIMMLGVASDMYYGRPADADKEAFRLAMPGELADRLVAA